MAGIYFVVFMAMSGLWACISVAWNGLIGDITPRHLRGMQYLLASKFECLASVITCLGFVSGMIGLMTLLGNGLGALWNVFYKVCIYTVLNSATCMYNT